MTVAERRMSASLATVELSPSGGGTRLTFTEQAAFFDRSDGPKLRDDGWRALLQQLDEEVCKSA
jgi:Activator of Hsp90 ATPase homolog 1-like protein